MNEQEEENLLEEIKDLLFMDKTNEQKKFLDKKIKELEEVPKSSETYSYIFESYEQDSIYPAIDGE